MSSQTPAPPTHGLDRIEKLLFFGGVVAFALLLLLFGQPLGDATVAGYTLLRDLQGQPVLLLRVDVPRSVYGQGLRSIRYFLGSIMAAGLVLGALTLALLEKTVLARLAGLSESVRRIGIRGDLSERVS